MTRRLTITNLEDHNDDALAHQKSDYTALPTQRNRDKYINTESETARFNGGRRKGCACEGVEQSFYFSFGLADECNRDTKKTTPLILFKQTE